MSNFFNAKLGFGTSNIIASQNSTHWQIGAAALHHAIDVGYNVLDTAEMYNDGQAESLIGKVLAENKKRNAVHIISKVLPTNATAVDNIITCCKNSINRMCCDYIDTYLLHWREPNDLPLQPIIEAFVKLKDLGLIKNYGVSNFGKRLMLEWKDVEKQMGLNYSFVTNQHHYSITQRNPERFYLDWQYENNITHMAYSPISNKRNNLLTDTKYLEIAQKHNYNPVQLALAWTIRNPGIIAIPTSLNTKHIELNFESQYLKLTAEVLSDIDNAFPL